MCLVNGDSNPQLTSLGIVDTHHICEEGWNLGHWKTHLGNVPAINWERCNSRHHLPLQDHSDPERSYKIPRVRCFCPQFPSVEREEKRFVVKEKVIVGVCRGARLCWLEWDGTEENRSVPRGAELPTPGAHLEQHCEMKNTAVSSLWQPSLWKAASGGWWSVLCNHIHLLERRFHRSC